MYKPSMDRIKQRVRDAERQRDAPGGGVVAILGLDGVWRAKHPNNEHRRFSGSESELFAWAESERLSPVIALPSNGREHARA